MDSVILDSTRLAFSPVFEAMATGHTGPFLSHVILTLLMMDCNYQFCSWLKTSMALFSLW